MPLEGPCKCQTAQKNSGKKYGRKPGNGNGGTFTFQKHQARIQGFRFGAPTTNVLVGASERRERRNDLGIPYSFIKNLLCDAGGMHVSVFVLTIQYNR